MADETAARTPTEMEKRVAAAIIDSGIRSDAADYDWTLSAARYVIRAMREPTEGMQRAPHMNGVTAGDCIMAACEAADAWHAMIDAASPPKCPSSTPVRSQSW